MEAGDPRARAGEAAEGDPGEGSRDVDPEIVPLPGRDSWLRPALTPRCPVLHLLGLRSASGAPIPSCLRPVPDLSRDVGTVNDRDRTEVLREDDSEQDAERPVDRVHPAEK